MSQRSVLVIDDSATIRRLVDTTLGPVGYSVLMAATAEEGVQLAEQARPDVIVLDHQLPPVVPIRIQSSIPPMVFTINIFL